MFGIAPDPDPDPSHPMYGLPLFFWEITVLNIISHSE